MTKDAIFIAKAGSTKAQSTQLHDVVDGWENDEHIEVRLVWNDEKGIWYIQHREKKSWSFGIPASIFQVSLWKDLLIERTQRQLITNVLMKFVERCEMNNRFPELIEEARQIMGKKKENES